MKYLTIASLLIIGIACVMLWLDGTLWSLFVMFILISVTLHCAYLAPNFLVVTDTALELHKLLGKLTIKMSEISSIDIFKSEGMEARIFGSGGFLGFTGLFYNKKIGNYRSYVGCYHQTFLVTMNNGKKYLFSCENRDLVVSLIKSKL